MSQLCEVRLWGRAYREQRALWGAETLWLRMWSGLRCGERRCHRTLLCSGQKGLRTISCLRLFSLQTSGKWDAPPSRLVGTWCHAGVRYWRSRYRRAVLHPAVCKPAILVHTLGACRLVSYGGVLQLADKTVSAFTKLKASDNGL